jgi:hypothetical protein
MDGADAHGWTGLRPRCDFLLDSEDDEQDEQDDARAPAPEEARR